MEDAQTPGIYDTLAKAECLDYHRSELEPVMRDFQSVDLGEIGAKTEYFGEELKRVHHEILRGPKLQMHRIGKHWSSWQYDDFKKHLGVLDMFKIIYGSDEEWMEKSVESVEGGLAYQKKKGDLYIFPKPVENAIGSIISGGVPLGLIVSGLVYVVSGGKSLLEIVAPVSVCGFSTLAYFSGIRENPLLLLADEMKERTEYVCSRLK